MIQSRWLLYLGDVAAILLFSAVGRSSHGLAAGADAFLATFNTAAPFIIGWLLVAPWLGAYRPQAVVDYRAALRTVALAIVPAVVAGALVRALFAGRFSPWTFYAVTLVMLALFMGIWRLLYTWYVQTMHRS